VVAILLATISNNSIRARGVDGKLFCKDRQDLGDSTCPPRARSEEPPRAVTVSHG